MLLQCGFMIQLRPKYIARTRITLLKGGEGRGSLSITDSYLYGLIKIQGCLLQLLQFNYELQHLPNMETNIIKAEMKRNFYN